jgi:NTE family protein
MSYPFYLRPIMVDGKLLFDGGLYNNFPVEILNKEFNPD